MKLSELEASKKGLVLELRLQLFGHWNSALWTYNSWFRGFDQWGPTLLPISQRRIHPRIERVSWPQGWSPLENSTLWSRVSAQWERKTASPACKQRPEQPPPKAKVPMYIRKSAYFNDIPKYPITKKKLSPKFTLQIEHWINVQIELFFVFKYFLGV